MCKEYDNIRGALQEILDDYKIKKTDKWEMKRKIEKIMKNY